MTRRVALFVTCLVDLWRPSVGMAAVALLEKAGCVVEVPDAQTCCGQPAYNSGEKAIAKRIARQVIETFEAYDHVVAPSGSCSGMIAEHYVEMFADEPEWHGRAAHLAKRTRELVSFLVEVCGMTDPEVAWPGTATYHDSCSGLRELGVKAQPRQLLARVAGLSLKPLAGEEVCCGFGGTFCVKYPEISDHMVGEKAAAVTATGADMLLAGDMGCLLNMAGKLKRLGAKTEVRHVAEVLAGRRDVAAIGDAG
jgi:L-lactate dehydrogenase complex protein LldE